MPQEECGRENRPERVGDAAARDVGRRAVDRLKEAALPVTQRGRRQDAEGTGEHRGFVAQDVAEHVLGEQHVEIAWAADQVHRGGIDQHVLERDLGELGAHEALDHRAPEARGLEHVRFVDRRHVPAARTGEGARDARDTLDLCDRIGADVGGVSRRAMLLAEIDSAGELPHEHEVDAIDDFRPDGRGIAQRRVNGDGPQVRIDAKLAPQRKQGRLGAQLRIGRAPLRPADRAEQHCVGATAQRQGRSRQPVTVQIDGRTAEERGRKLEVVPELRRDRFEDAHGLRDDLRSDSVAAEYRDQRLHRWRCS